MFKDKKTSKDSAATDTPKHHNPFRKRSGNVIMLGGSEEAAENNLKNKEKMNTKKKLMLGAFVFLVIIVVIVFLRLSRLQYKGYKVVSSNEIIYEANASYKEFGGNLLKYTPDGVSYINSSGEIVWTAGIDMKVPVAETNGEYAVVADKGGNTVRVFNTEGAVGEVTMPYTICDIDVANQGAFAVVLESDKTNYINMYSSTGDQIYEIQTSIDKSGYPVDICISDDGQKLFTSYLYMEGVETKINLAAYNFGEVGQNENADRMVGGFVFDEEIIPKVEFVSNDTVVAFSDSRMIIYSMKEKPSQQAVVEYKAEIESIFYNDKYIGTIQKNDNAESKDKYIMKVYDLKGNLNFVYPFSLEYNNIYAAEKEIIVTGGTECLIINKNGKTKFKYAFKSQIKNMIPSSGRNKYIVTFDNRTDLIKLKLKDKKENKTEDSASNSQDQGATENTTPEIATNNDAGSN